MAIEKIKILGAVLELLAKQHCQFSQSTKKWAKWAELAVQCCLAGSSKTAPRILILSIAMHCEKLSTWTPEFWREYRGFGSPCGFWSSNLVVINRYV